ncbi:Low affinity sulfate transporter 3 [Capsicum annuum]|uniref:Low affinity sulfate transporter 3 n=1 Tax=Capsicum annuum TaxID=4072 RepID=A0A2G2Y8F0_CAPAN|nr:Low affinity sulfate transporter 3 [Capsicum annuum]
MGSSREIVIGPVAVVSLLLSSMIPKLEDPTANPIAYRKLVLTVTFFAGIFQAAFGLLRLGFLVDFLSHAAIVGFMAGAACVIGLQQLKSLLGIANFTKKTHIISVLTSISQSMHTEAIAVGRSFATIKGYRLDGNKEMLAMGVMNITGSLSSSYVATVAGLDLDNEVFSQVKFGWEGSGLLMVFGFQALLVRLCGVEDGLVYLVLGFGSKDWFDLWKLVYIAFGARSEEYRFGGCPRLCLKGSLYVEGQPSSLLGVEFRDCTSGMPKDIGLRVALWKKDITRHRMKSDPRRVYDMGEGHKFFQGQTGTCLSLALCPSMEYLSRTFHCMSILHEFMFHHMFQGSFSRTAVNVSVGCETAVSNIVMVVTVLISLEFFSRLLYFTPISILASIIISVLPGLINLSEAKYIWKVDKMDFLACATAFLGDLFVSVEIGLLLAVGISFAKIILNSIQPGKEKLGRLPGSDLFGDVEQYPIASTTRGALIVRVKSSLFCFANANFITGRILNIALKEHGEGAIENRDQDRVKLVILDMSNFLNIDTSSIASLEELNELESNGMQLPQLVVENVLAFNENFWIRIAAREDTCKSNDDKAWFHFLISLAGLCFVTSFNLQNKLC